MKILLSFRFALSSSRLSRNIVREKPERLLNRRQSKKRAVLGGKIKEGIPRLKSDMVDISAEQKRIREGQKQIREKFEEIQREREQLQKETEIISQQSIGIRGRLNLMFQILKARAESDSAKATQLTQSLRDLIAKPKQQNELLSNGEG